MILILYLSVVAQACVLAEGGDKKNNLWVAHIKGGEQVARGIAQELGLTYKDNGFGQFKDHYAMTVEEHPEVDVEDITRGLLDHPNVQWVKQQVNSGRSMDQMEKRKQSEQFDDDQEQANIDFFIKTIRDTPTFKNCKTGTFACTDWSPHLLAYLKYLGQTDVQKLGTFSTDPADSSTLSTYEGETKCLYPDHCRLSAYAARFNDPKWRNQWFVQDYRTKNLPVMDHNVVPVYDMGITGSSVIVGVVGDGVKDHADLGNYNHEISFNFCENKKGSLPTWRFGLTGSSYDTVGTSSAGVIAMKPNNELCGVGIAHGATIVGLRMTGCSTKTANVEASALTYNLDTIDIYCNTWIFDDEPLKTLVKLSNTMKNALELGTSMGRKNKGAIYVFPASSDIKQNNCPTNGLVNNPYVITIGSTVMDPTYAIYHKHCAAIFAAAYSGEKLPSTDQIPTITADGKCSTFANDKPIGPAIASGIFALVLQHRPHLTYRDMMHLIAMTAEVAPLACVDDTWYRNGRGLWVNKDYGFGLLNAKNMITLAENWQTVPEKHICVLNKKLDKPLQFDYINSETITIDASECSSGSDAINYLEHVELQFNFNDCSIRGVLHLNITSPSNTKTELLEIWLKENYTENFKDWNIMSLHNWGEDANGLWQVIARVGKIDDEKPPHCKIHEMTLKLHGTKEMPNHYNQPRKYAAFRLPNGDTN